MINNICKKTSSKKVKIKDLTLLIKQSKSNISKYMYILFRSSDRKVVFLYDKEILEVKEKDDYELIGKSIASKREFDLMKIILKELFTIFGQL